jgi:hypothetical protein
MEVKSAARLNSSSYKSAMSDSTPDLRIIKWIILAEENQKATMQANTLWKKARGYITSGTPPVQLCTVTSHTDDQTLDLTRCTYL